MLNLLTIIVLLFTTLYAPAWAGKSSSKPKQDLHQVIFQAEGSRCVSCLRRLERHLRKTKGVLQAVVSLARKGETTIIYDANKTSMAKISKRAGKENYKTIKVKDKKIDKLPDTPIYARRDRSEPGITKDSIIPSFNQLK